jgi:hypothetical protein
MRDTASSSHAEKLFRALHDAGAAYDFGRMEAVRLRGLRAKRTLLTFDDEANYHPQPPNTELQGASAAKIVDALTAAGIKEDDGSLSVSCSKGSGPPTCEHGWLQQTKASKLDATRSEDLWRSFMGAATSRSNGADVTCRLDEVTRITARDFTHDGKTLRFVLRLEKPLPMPRPASPPAPLR